jgi:hypothetical protein
MFAGLIVPHQTVALTVANASVALPLPLLLDV